MRRTGHAFSALRIAAAAVLDLLFPPRCHACRAPVPELSGIGLCRQCREQVELLYSPLCICCGTPLLRSAGNEDRFCAACLQNSPPFDSARSLARYAPPVSSLLHRLKFTGDTGAAAVLRQLGVVAGPPCELIIPVPLHVSRLRSRGLNQSQVLARHFFPAECRKIETDLLIRRKRTVAQTGLDGRQRRRNLRDAFAVVGPEGVRGRTVRLVDDVFTTGTTVAECARTLKNAGATEVHVWTVARVERFRP